MLRFSHKIALLLAVVLVGSTGQCLTACFTQATAQECERPSARPCHRQDAPAKQSAKPCSNELVLGATVQPQALRIAAHAADAASLAAIVPQAATVYPPVALTGVLAEEVHSPPGRVGISSVLLRI